MKMTTRTSDQDDDDDDGADDGGRAFLLLNQKIMFSVAHEIKICYMHVSS